MRTKSLLAVLISALASASAFAAPPVAKVEVINTVAAEVVNTVDAEVVNTVDVQVVNAIPLENMVSLGTTGGLGGPGGGSGSVTFVGIPPGWIHSINASLSSASDSNCRATLQLIIQTGAEKEITKIGGLAAQRGNNSMSHDFSVPIQIDFDDSVSDFGIGLSLVYGPSTSGELCLFSLGAVYEANEGAAAALTSESIRVVKEEHFD